MSRQEDYPLHEDAPLTTGTGAGYRTGTEFSSSGAARQQSSGVTEQAKDTADDLMQRGRQQATSQLNDQKMRLAEGLDGLARAIRQMSQDLQGEQAMLASYADQGAVQVDHFARYLQEHDVNEMIGDVERYARQRPALFIGGAFALGLIAARFLKS
jgi:hypothetical protein